jgi:hypothetical protein
MYAPADAAFRKVTETFLIYGITPSDAAFLRYGGKKGFNS